jgi:hypothetical protein
MWLYMGNGKAIPAYHCERRMRGRLRAAISPI